MRSCFTNTESKDQNRKRYTETAKIFKDTDIAITQEAKSVLVSAGPMPIGSALISTPLHFTVGLVKSWLLCMCTLLADLKDKWAVTIHHGLI